MLMKTALAFVTLVGIGFVTKLILKNKLEN